MAIKGKKVSELIETTSIDNHYILSHCGKQNFKIPAKKFEYKSGTGINITDNIVSIDLQAGNGINIDGNIVSIDLVSGNGIDITDNIVSINLVSGNGINIDGNTVSIDLIAGNGININENTISITLTAGDFVEIAEDNSISVKTSDVIADDPTTVPTNKAVWDCVNNLKNYTEGDYISISDDTSAISVKYSSVVEDDPTTIPTNKAVFDHALKKVEGKELIHIEYDKENYVNTIRAAVKYIDFVVRDDINDYISDSDDFGFILFDDLLNPRYMSFSNELVDGSFMFQYTDMRKFEIPTPNLVVGNQMFDLCQKMYLFDGDLRSLKDGNKMFNGCILNEISLNSIATTIQDINHLNKEIDEHWLVNEVPIVSTNRGRIDIGYNENIVPKLNADKYGNILVKKGWTVYLNGILFGGGGGGGESTVSYDISRANGYAPDASKWQSEIYNTYNLTVTSVDGTTDSAYNGAEYVCLVEHDYIENATGLWQGNKTLTSWDADLNALKIGTNMFDDSALISYNGELNSLEHGEYMFKNCNLGSFTINLPNMTDGEFMFFNNTLTPTLSIFNGKLSSLQDGRYMFYDTGIASFVTDNLDKLENSDTMFRNSNLTTFNYDLPSLTHAHHMFLGCSNLKTLGPNQQGQNIDCNKLPDCSHMFNVANNVTEFYINFDSVQSIDDIFGYYNQGGNNHKIEKFYSSLASITTAPKLFTNSLTITDYNADMQNLQTGNYMFNECHNLTNYYGNLDSLYDGTYMFYKTKLSQFNNNLPKLRIGYDMFSHCQFVTFTINLTNLQDGTRMFENCVNLTHFTSDLNSLIYGDGMFNGCTNLQEFDAEMNSINNINTVF